MVKSHYDSHKTRKTPCESKAENVEVINHKKLIVDNTIIADIKMNTTKQQIQKPFLKWVGGKTQIIDNIISKLPNEMNNYHEMFLGGGSVLFAILSLQKQNKINIKHKIYAYDINRVLIDVYKHIQSNTEELYKQFQQYMNEYDNLKGTIINRNPTSIIEAKSSKESYYYWMRNKYNKIKISSIEKSALFMFINKTCFRGMYREGPNGYNVPYGHYKKTPAILSEKNMSYISELIQDVEFIHCSFEESMKRVQEGDFIYLDPPYAPENKKSFVGYVADGFSLEMHQKLFNDIKNLYNVKFVMSNAKVDLVLGNFEGFKCEEVNAKRAINSKKPGSMTTEVIIYN